MHVLVLAVVTLDARGLDQRVRLRGGSTAAVARRGRMSPPGELWPCVCEICLTHTTQTQRPASATQNTSRRHTETSERHRQEKKKNSAARWPLRE